MEIVPIRIFWMTLVSLAFGAAMGVVNDLNRCIRSFLGVNYIRGKRRSLLPSKIQTVNRKAEIARNGNLKKILLPVIMFIQDISFFVLAGAGVAILDYYFNNGRARIYTPVAATVGFALYFFTVGRLSPYLFWVISLCLRTVGKTAFEIIYTPIRYFVRFLGNIAKKINVNVNKTIAKRQKIVYNNKKKNVAVRDASKGFLSLAENRAGGP